jgi:putative sigma-54 modulation protein
MESTVHQASARTAFPVSVEGRSGGVTSELRNFAHQRLSVSLCRHSEKVQSAEVWLEDVNGPRGGIDKRCRVRLRLAPRGQATATADAANEFAAVAHAARRAATVLDRKQKRIRAPRRVSAS